MERTDVLSEVDLETWRWNTAQQPRLHAVLKSYLGGACRVIKWENESNEIVYDRCVMGT